MATLLRSQALLAPSARMCPQRAFTAVRPVFAPARMPVVERGSLVVMAAETKDKKKKMPSPVKRALISEERRMYNKSHKSACATRIKKVILKAQELLATLPKTEEEVKPLEQLVAAAYQEIDKAVVKGILHENTAARKKARCARYKRAVLMAAGFFKPAEDHPEYAKYVKLAAKQAAASS